MNYLVVLLSLLLCLPLRAQPTLPEAEARDLIQLREEEKMARDVYLALFDQWETPVFQVIAHSEQHHMNAVGALLTRFGLEDPLDRTFEEAGVFEQEEIRRLYVSLLREGMLSELSALRTALRLEETDIRDLQQMLRRTRQPELRRVYDSLLRGAYHHLRAVYAELSARDEIYLPQVLSPQAFADILATEAEAGPAAGN